MKPITKKLYGENDIFQVILSLKTNREKRQKRKAFLVEGVRSINNCIKFGWTIEAVIYSHEKKLSHWANDILAKNCAEYYYEISNAMMEKLSEKEFPSELLLVVQMPADSADRIKITNNFVGVVFDRPSSPGNLGTLIRSADAMGASCVIITGHACDLYDSQTIRASTGSFFSIPCIRLPSHKELLPLIKKIKDVQIIGTDESGEKNITQVDLTKPTLVLAGNETDGLSSAYKQLATQLVKIPMTGSASSFNVACATSIVLYEVARQRKFIFE